MGYACLPLLSLSAFLPERPVNPVQAVTGAAVTEGTLDHFGATPVVTALAVSLGEIVPAMRIARFDFYRALQVFYRLPVSAAIECIACVALKFGDRALPRLALSRWLLIAIMTGVDRAAGDGQGKRGEDSKAGQEHSDFLSGKRPLTKGNNTPISQDCRSKPPSRGLIRRHSRF